MFKEVLQAIEAYDTIIIHRHNRPDGDAMGSQLGLKHLILENYPHKTVYAVGDAPGYFGFMEGAVMGICEMTRLAQRYEDTDCNSGLVVRAREIVAFEEQNLETAKAYL